MAQELLYTSAPRGLKPGSRGFCTVLATQGMPAPLASAVEALSGYRAIYPPSDERAARNPVVYSHLKMQATGRSWHVLSRIADYGLDYSQRPNKLAHHVILDNPAEQLPGGPANLLSTSGFMRESWEGDPTLVSHKPITREQRPHTGVCEQWKEVTGDAGWAGVVAESFLNAPDRQVILLFEPGQDILPLIAEAISLLPPEKRWDVTFSTYFTGLATGTTCNWRAIVAGSKEATESLRNVNALRIDLIGGLSPIVPTGGLAEIARLGPVPLVGTQKTMNPPILPCDNSNQTASFSDPHKHNIPITLEDVRETAPLRPQSIARSAPGAHSQSIPPIRNAHIRTHSTSPHPHATTAIYSRIAKGAGAFIAILLIVLVGLRWRSTHTRPSTNDASSTSIQGVTPSPSESSTTDSDQITNVVDSVADKVPQDTQIVSSTHNKESTGDTATEAAKTSNEESRNEMSVTDKHGEQTESSPAHQSQPSYKILRPLDSAMPDTNTIYEFQWQFLTSLPTGESLHQLAKMSPAEQKRTLKGALPPDSCTLFAPRWLHWKQRNPITSDRSPIILFFYEPNQTDGKFSPTFASIHASVEDTSRTITYTLRRSQQQYDIVKSKYLLWSAIQIDRHSDRSTPTTRIDFHQPSNPPEALRTFHSGQISVEWDLGLPIEPRYSPELVFESLQIAANGKNENVRNLAIPVSSPAEMQLDRLTEDIASLEIKNTPSPTLRIEYVKERNSATIKLTLIRLYGNKGLLDESKTQLHAERTPIAKQIKSDLTFLALTEQEEIQKAILNCSVESANPKPVLDILHKASDAYFSKLSAHRSTDRDKTTIGNNNTFNDDDGSNEQFARERKKLITNIEDKIRSYCDRLQKLSTILNSTKEVKLNDIRLSHQIYEVTDDTPTARALTKYILDSTFNSNAPAPGTGDKR